MYTRFDIIGLLLSDWILQFKLNQKYEKQNVAYQTKKIKRSSRNTGPQNALVTPLL